MKSERAVNNPENHGWEEVNGKWIWASGRNTGHIVDGDTEGQIATWHDPSNAWTPDGAVVVSGGKVGIGTDNPRNQLHISSSGSGFSTIRLDAHENAEPARWQLRSHDGVFDVRDATAESTRLTIDSSGNVGIGTSVPSSVLDVFGPRNGVQAEFNGDINGRGLEISTALINGVNNGLVDFNARGEGADGTLTISTDGTERMRIDSIGNVGIGTEANSSLQVKNSSTSQTTVATVGGVNEGIDVHNVGQITLGTLVDANAGRRPWAIKTESGQPGNFGVYCGNSATSDPTADGFVALTIDSTGDATFSGNVTVSGTAYSLTSNFLGRNGGIHFNQGNVTDGPLYIIPKNVSGQNTDGKTNIGWGSARFKNCYLSGSVLSARHGVSVGTRDLIETLATLRASTLDETVDVRQALASACDKLIEKFESMQEVATQEIEEETDANTN